AARFFGAAQIVYDGADTLYVSDYSGNTIRKVSITSATVTTVAGSGAVAGGAADGVGTAARFKGPSGITLDEGGRLFVADVNNGTLRQIDPVSRSVTTVVGIAGLNISDFGPLPAGLERPRGLAAMFGGEVGILTGARVLAVARGL